MVSGHWCWRGEGCWWRVRGGGHNTVEGRNKGKTGERNEELDVITTDLTRRKSGTAAMWRIRSQSTETPVTAFHSAEVLLFVSPPLFHVKKKKKKAGRIGRSSKPPIGDLISVWSEAVKSKSKLNFQVQYRTRDNRTSNGRLVLNNRRCSRSR